MDDIDISDDLGSYQIHKETKTKLWFFHLKLS